LASEQLQSAQEIWIQRVAGRRLQPKLNHVEPARLLELTSVLGDTLAGIDVGQHIHFERDGRKHAGNAKQGGRSAQNQHHRTANQWPAVAATGRY